MGNQCTTQCKKNQLAHDMDERNVLIVYAHHDDHSFVGAVRDLVKETLQSRGFHVFESSLYQMKFNPVMSIKEFMVDLEDNNDNEIAENGFQSLPSSHIPLEVKEEMNKVLAAHYIVFVFPLWWESCPAILKGWFDRVLIGGILQDGGSYQGREKLLGKKAVCIVPATPPPAYSPAVEDDEQTNTQINIQNLKSRKQQSQGPVTSSPQKPRRKTTMIPRNFDERLKHITHGTLAFAGFDVLHLLSNLNIQITDEDGIKHEYLMECRRYFEELEEQEPLVRAVDIPFD